jgi:hypothetical protein
MFSRDSGGIFSGNYSVDDYSLLLKLQMSSVWLGNEKCLGAPPALFIKVMCSAGRMRCRAIKLTVKIDPFD